MFIIVIFLTSFLTIYFLRKDENPTINSRFVSIDGLRGFLGVSVYIHHAYFWHQYLKSKQWSNSGNYIYNQLGQTSVSLFFMITGFLFLNKIIRTKNINWKLFFINRLYRIAPLYFLSVIIILILFTIKLKITSIFTFSYFTYIFHELTFSFFQGANQQFPIEMVLINSGVTWSLAYEIFFYISLPIISFTIHRVKKVNYLHITILLILISLFTYLHNIDFQHIYSFLGGVLSAIIYIKTSLSKYLKSVYFSFIILICLLLISQFNSSGNFYSKIATIILFICISNGNTFFNVLNNKLLIKLGQISYSTYLLHGIILYLLMNNIIGINKATQISDLKYWLIIIFTTPFLIISSKITFQYIEKPFIDTFKRKYEK